MLVGKRVHICLRQQLGDYSRVLPNAEITTKFLSKHQRSKITDCRAVGRQSTSSGRSQIMFCATLLDPFPD